MLDMLTAMVAKRNARLGAVPQQGNGCMHYESYVDYLIDGDMPTMLPVNRRNMTGEGIKEDTFEEEAPRPTSQERQTATNYCTTRILEGRPCLWDKRSDNYKNKIEREKAWEEIFTFLDDEYEKGKFKASKGGEKIVQKWVNIRDAFIRSTRCKSGQGAKKSYIYSEHLQFLLAIYEPSETESSTLGGETEQVEEESDPFEPTTSTSDSNLSTAGRKKLGNKSTRSARELNNIENEIMHALKKPCKEKENSFFASFEDYITDMTEGEKMEVHMGLLQTIMQVKCARTQNVYVLDEQIKPNK
ncbi:hypothetical protein JTE90_015796 [Oedothorax gibbosus]|uniref:MADF domain-containing protein n=1 Tax=Oedothorax gibbosus TaxID=931172 RepID=A0AAV6TKE8_9ARAC|nr:hypothetical protein JTE90_015796 [Oedothorax gibbosus]